jgi:hypothetical protein
VLSFEQREYNRIMQQRHRQREKELQNLYQQTDVTNISFTEFAKQYKLTRWQKLSITLSDNELKLDKISFKLSDGQLRLKMKNKGGESL